MLGGRKKYSNVKKHLKKKRLNKKRRSKKTRLSKKNTQLGGAPPKRLFRLSKKHNRNRRPNIHQERRHKLIAFEEEKMEKMKAWKDRWDKELTNNELKNIKIPFGGDDAKLADAYTFLFNQKTPTLSEGDSEDKRNFLEGVNAWFEQKRLEAEINGPPFQEIVPETQLGPFFERHFKLRPVLRRLVFFIPKQIVQNNPHGILGRHVTQKELNEQQKQKSIATSRNKIVNIMVNEGYKHPNQINKSRREEYIKLLLKKWTQKQAYA